MPKSAGNQARFGAGLLGSAPKKRSKLRFRFDFSGQNDKRTVEKKTRDDDILDSLSRQAHSENPPVPKTVSEIGEAVESVRQEPKHGHAGRSAFLVFLGGFLAIWSIGYVTKVYEIPYLSGLLQNQVVGMGIQTVTANPVPAGAVSALVLLSALYALHKKKGTRVYS